MYSTRFCPYCIAAKRLLVSKGVDFENIAVDGDAQLRSHMQTLTGRTSVPQIFIGDTHVGGYDDMAAMDDRGELDPLINAG